MIFTVDSVALNEGVISVSKALPVRTSMAVLEGILIRADEAGVHIICSDLMMQKECVLPASVREEGECVVKGRLFGEIVRKLPAGPANVSLKEQTLTLSCGKSNNRLQCMEYDEFPLMAFTGEDVYEITLGKEDCRTLINRTAFAIGNDEGRPILSGVFMESGGDTLSMVATDSFQFAKNAVKVENELPVKSCIIPGKTVTEVARMAEECAADTMTVVFSRTHMKVDIGSACMVARLLEGNYLDYSRFIPKECKTRVLIDKDSFNESVDRASLVSREGNNGVHLTFENETLFVRAESAVGRVDDELPAQIMGPDIEITFNVKYIMNVLKNIDAEKIYLEMNASINPCVIRPQSEEDSLFLIVPMRTL